MKDKGERRETSVNERGQIEYIRNERVKKWTFLEQEVSEEEWGESSDFFFNGVLKREE